MFLEFLSFDTFRYNICLFHQPNHLWRRFRDRFQAHISHAWEGHACTWIRFYQVPKTKILINIVILMYFVWNLKKSLSIQSYGIYIVYIRGVTINMSTKKQANPISGIILLSTFTIISLQLFQRCSHSSW